MIHVFVLIMTIGGLEVANDNCSSLCVFGALILVTVLLQS